MPTECPLSAIKEDTSAKRIALFLHPQATFLRTKFLRILKNQIQYLTTSRADIFIPEVIGHLHTLRGIGNKADHLHLEMKPEDKPKVIDGEPA